MRRNISQIFFVVPNLCPSWAIKLESIRSLTKRFFKKKNTCYIHSNARSMCRYASYTNWNILNAHGPCINAPLILDVTWGHKLGMHVTSFSSISYCRNKVEFELWNGILNTYILLWYTDQRRWLKDNSSLGRTTLKK